MTNLFDASFWQGEFGPRVLTPPIAEGQTSGDPSRSAPTPCTSRTAQPAGRSRPSRPAWLDTVAFDIDDDLTPLVEESVAFYAPRMGESAARELFTGPTVNLGTIEGGTAINRVPERARARLDVRLTAGVDTPLVLAGIEAVLAEHPVAVADVSWSVGTTEALDSPLVAATSEVAAAVSGDRVYRRSATGGGDIKDPRNAGLSAVEFAFGTETAHAPDEYITVEALKRNAAAFTRLPVELATRVGDESR